MLRHWLKQPKASCSSRPRKRGDGRLWGFTPRADAFERPVISVRAGLKPASPNTRGRRQRRRNDSSPQSLCGITRENSTGSGPVAAGRLVAKRHARPQHLPARFGAARIQAMNFKRGSGASPVRPNPSLKRSANGRPPGPGRWYAVHFHRPGPGVLPSSPA